MQAGAVSSLIAPGALWLSHLLLSQAITAGAGLSQERWRLILTLCPTYRGVGQEWRKKTWDVHVQNLPGLSALAEMAASRFPPAVWCWMSPSDLLDVTPDLGELESAQNLAERAALKKQPWICLAAEWGLLNLGVVVAHRAHTFPMQEMATELFFLWLRVRTPFWSHHAAVPSPWPCPQ